MKAVVWTDAFQAFIMVGGMLAIVITVSFTFHSQNLAKYKTTIYIALA